MNRRLTVSAIALVAVAITAACSQRGALPVTNQPAMGGAAATHAGGFPTRNGSTYIYSNDEYPVAAGTASPQPPWNWVDTVGVRTGVSFDGAAGLVSFAHSPSDGSEPVTDFVSLKTTGTTQELLDVGQRRELGGGKLFWSKLRYITPKVELLLPFRAGATWKNTAAYVSTSRGNTSLNGAYTTSDETSNADGSFTSSFRDYDKNGKVRGYATTTVSSDGSATSSSVFGKCRMYQNIGVPVPAAKGTYVIPVHSSVSQGCIGATPGPSSTTIPDWYPGGKLPPSPLARSSSTDMGTVTIPAICQLPASVPKRGEKIVRRSSDLDPLGVSRQTVDVGYYANGIGLVCDRLYAKDQRIWVLVFRRDQRLTAYRPGTGKRALAPTAYAAHDDMLDEAASHQQFLERMMQLAGARVPRR